MDAERWQRLSPLLDALLELPEQQRSEHLAALRREDAALADDLAQDLWFAVVDSACRYEVRSRFTTWLFTMAHHRLVDHWRRQRPGISL